MNVAKTTNMIRNAVHAGSDLRMEYEGGNIDHQQWLAGLERLTEIHTKELNDYIKRMIGIR